MTTPSLPAEILERRVLRADWLAALDELSRLRLVARDDTGRLSEEIRLCFADGQISLGDVGDNVLFERRIGDPTHLGAPGDLTGVLARMRSLVPERVLQDSRWRLFALVLIGYAFRMGVFSDGDLTLAALLIVALPGDSRRDTEIVAAPRTHSSQDRLAPLYWLLRELFTSEELRMFLHLQVPGGEELGQSLPSTTIGHANYTFEVFEGLRRRGWIDAALFDTLVRLRPGQAASIARVRKIVLDEASAPRGDRPS